MKRVDIHSNDGSHPAMDITQYGDHPRTPEYPGDGHSLHRQSYVGRERTVVMSGVRDRVTVLRHDRVPYRRYRRMRNEPTLVVVDHEPLRRSGRKLICGNVDQCRDHMLYASSLRRPDQVL